ncbi:MAG: addiction module toxin RelE [Gammaproteobacteria bacterium]|nr:MAG: addiction module toxin RelE [Gammaproteobacteria bacterium]RKZ72637.1 MAG: addiction module toxin RelE [Gammaproteobacteria bacterium]
MITIAETEQFQKKVNQLLTENEKNDLISYLSENPNTGALIQGTSGVRKLRWARSGMGKSAGTRIIYYYHNKMMPLYLLTLFGKNEKSNLSMGEKQILSKTVKELVSYWRRKNE